MAYLVKGCYQPPLTLHSGKSGHKTVTIKSEQCKGTRIRNTGAQLTLYRFISKHKQLHFMLQF